MKIRMYYLLALIAAFSFYSCEQEDLQILEEVETIQEYQADLNASETSPSDLDIELETGAKLQFFVLDEESVLVWEFGECVGCSAISTLDKLHEEEYNALDIFWAYSTPDMEVLPVLEKLYSKSVKSKTEKQGWARKELATISSNSLETRSADFACDDNWFESHIIGGFQAHVYKKLNQRPIDGGFTPSPLATNYADGNAHYDNRYTKWARYANTTKWAGKICGKSVQNSYNNHYYNNSYFGPEISLEYHDGYRWQSLTMFGVYQRKEIAANSYGYFHWFANSSSRKDYRLRVVNAMPYDEFDFMMTERP